MSQDTTQLIAAPCCWCGQPGLRQSETVPGDIPCLACEQAERVKGTWDDIPDTEI